ncbi:hypothetical protein LP419_26445 [Massilia sp. H-1]|nr:hypothetical protein LP419_26445 [Massilia sp. H-1]
MFAGKYWPGRPARPEWQRRRPPGLTVLRERKLEGLDETMVVLQVPPGASTGALLDQLRLRDPDGSYDYNHVYMGSERGACGCCRASRPRACLAA